MSNDLLDRVHRRLRRNVEEAEKDLSRLDDLRGWSIVTPGLLKYMTLQTNDKIKHALMILEAFEEAVAMEQAEKDGGGE